jgi:hypothetical protein
VNPAYAVVCDNCGAQSRYSDGDYIAAWNTRQAQTDALIEALEVRLAEADTLIEKARSAMVFDQSWNVDAYILVPQFDAYLDQSK